MASQPSSLSASAWTSGAANPASADRAASTLFVVMSAPGMLDSPLHGLAQRQSR
jgi:hypothetical protein